MRSYEGRRGRSSSREHRGGNESADAGPLGLEGGLALELAAGLDEDGVELREPLLGREEARDGPLEVAELVRVGLGAGRGPVDVAVGRAARGLLRRRGRRRRRRAAALLELELGHGADPELGLALERDLDGGRRAAHGHLDDDAQGLRRALALDDARGPRARHAAALAERVVREERPPRGDGEALAVRVDVVEQLRGLVAVGVRRAGLQLRVERDPVVEVLRERGQVHGDALRRPQRDAVELALQDEIAGRVAGHALQRQQVRDAVGLAVAVVVGRPQHLRLRLVEGQIEEVLALEAARRRHARRLRNIRRNLSKKGTPPRRPAACA